MRIVVYGSERRVGALHRGDVVDLNGAYIKLACEVLDEALPYAMDQTPRVGGTMQGGFENDKLFLRIGDVVEVSSTQIGTLRNKIVAKG